MGLRQVDLAKLLRVHEMSVVNWEKNKYLPSSTYRQRIREILDIDL